MLHLARGKTYGCSDPKITFNAHVDGWATDLETLEFQVFDVSNATKEKTPVQVYPAAVGTRASVDVLNDCPVGGRVDVGRYIVEWAIDGAEAAGAHEIRWYWTWSAGGTEYTSRERIEVLDTAGTIPSPMYASVSDLREEGVSVATASDIRCLRILSLASRLIERYTGQFFEPRWMTQRIDGRGTDVVRFNNPVISVTEVRIVAIDTEDLLLSIDMSEGDSYKVYNRHLYGVVSPDDRMDPRVEAVFGAQVFGAGSFYRGSQNIHIDGLFGYTDADGGLVGETPEPIRLATVLLANKYLSQATSDDAAEAAIRGRLVSEKTRDQSYKLADPSKGNSGGGRWGTSFTGDPAIDSILALYVRPPILGSA